MPASNSDNVSVVYKTGSGRQIALPASTKTFDLPGSILGPQGNRDVVQLKDGEDNWELLATLQRNQEFTMELHADGVMYSGTLANWFSMVRREGIYVADSYIDAGGTVWTLRMEITITRSGSSRTLTYPSVYIDVEAIKISPEGNKVSAKHMLTGPTDPSWSS